MLRSINKGFLIKPYWVQIMGQIKNVRVLFNVDIGVGDVIVQKAEQRRINTQLPDFEAPIIKNYSL